MRHVSVFAALASAAPPAIASLGTVASADMHEPDDLNALASKPLLGGYIHVSGDASGALDVGTYAVLKLNCARSLANPPCPPLDNAQVLDAVSHVTEVDYWFLNVSVGVLGRTVHVNVAVDDLSETRARDFECPSLDHGKWAAYNLVRVAENGVDLTNPCSFEPRGDANVEVNGDTAVLGTDALGESLLRVTGEKKMFAAWRPWDRPAAPEPAVPGDDGLDTSAYGDGTSAELAGDGASAKGDGTSTKGDGASAKGDGTSAKGDSNGVKGDGTSAKGDSNGVKGDGTSAKGDSNGVKGDGTSAKEYIDDEAQNPDDLFGPNSDAPVAHYDCPLVTMPPTEWHPPASYDLRDEWGDVCDADKPADQGRCGSCWAHAFAHMYSYRMCIQSGGKFREMISAQQLISCDWGGTCTGGFDGYTARHFDNNDGGPMAMLSAADFPYTDGLGVRTEGSGEACRVRGTKTDGAADEQGKNRSYAVDFSSYQTANYWYEQPINERDAHSVKSVWFENCDLKRTRVQSDATLGENSIWTSAEIGEQESQIHLDPDAELAGDGASAKGDGASAKGDGTSAKGAYANATKRAWWASSKKRNKATETRDSEDVPPLLEQQRWLMYPISTFGPVTAAMSASSFPHGGDPNRVHSCVGLCESIDHSVIIVGWGESRGVGGAEPEPYWIVQNSWTDK